MSGLVQTNQPVLLTLGATFTPNQADSGKLFLLSAAPGGGTVISLPLAQNIGTHYRFMLTAIAANAITIGVAAGAIGVRGSLINCNGAAAVTLPVVITSVTVGWTAAGAIGDFIDVYHMGNNIWSVHGISSVNNGLAVV